VGDEAGRIPVVCDLTDAPDTAEQRIAEYRDLFARHLVDRSMTDGVVRFRFRADDGVERWVRDLMTREQRCCGFFAFSVHVQGDEVRWDTTVGDDDAARAMLDEWARLPETVAVVGSGIHAE
jgi:hypothetical protein